MEVYKVIYINDVSFEKYKEGENMVVKIKKDEQIGFHKGSIDTLLKERQELVRIITILDQLLKAHATALNQLGVKMGSKEEKDLENSLK